MEKPSLFARVGFEALVFFVMMVVFDAETILLSAVLSNFGFSPDAFKNVGCVLVLPGLVLARLGADRILKSFGYPRSGHTQETQGKMLANPEGFVADDEVVEVYLPKSLIRGLILTCLAICLAMIAIMIFVPSNKIKVVSYL